MLDHESLEHATTVGKWAIDALSIGVMLGALVNILPSVAAILTIIWTCIRIWETETVRRWAGRPPRR